MVFEVISMRSLVGLFVASILLSSTLSLLGNARAEARQPWKLDGAAERIELHRKGPATLQFVLPDGNLRSDSISVEIDLQKHDFLFGVAMTQSWALFDQPHFERYRDHIGELFNSVTLGFFWGEMERQPGQFRRVEYTESNLQWAKSRGMTLKGMPLLWHIVVPKWLDRIKDPEELDRLIADHIRYLVETYPDIEIWGTFNEVIGALKPLVQENAIVRWAKHKGGTSAAQAWVLKTAQEVVSGKRNIINHYTHKDPAYKNLIRYLIETDTQFDAIGIQTHMHTKQNILTEKALWNLLEEYGAFGKPIHLTEVTVVSSKPFVTWRDASPHNRAIEKARGEERLALARRSKPELEQYQASYIMDFYTLAFSHPAVESITYWSVSDLYEWRGSAGGLLDTEHNPKPAYHALKSLIKDKWHTSVSSRTDETGNLTFRGFYGVYRGTATTGGQKFAFELTHSPDHKGDYVIRLN
jgi:GH35 family endo-1,4-beta-xylanase